jgi:glycosyltransferase involved in cell wall biosynthesis
VSTGRRVRDCYRLSKACEQKDRFLMIEDLDISTGNPSIRVCLTVASLNPKTGGTARSVSALAENVKRSFIYVHLLCPEAFPLNRIRWRYQEERSNKFFLQRKYFIHFIKKHRTMLVHDNGIWHPFNHMVSGVCNKLIIPRMVSSHGMLEPWSLQYKKWKKRIAWKLYQYKDLKTAICFHATALSEAENIRKLGFTQPIAVIPNGVDFPANMPQKKRAQNGVKRALFLSRIHPKKGLKDLVNAWSKVKPENWMLFIAGPDEGGHENEIKALVKKLGLSLKVHFLGNLSDIDKWQIYRSSDLFILPTFSENFGIVVAEALAAEIPVITTTETPWRILEEEKCGWCIPPGEQSLAAILLKVLRISDQELHEMGQRGRKMALARYNWENAGHSMSDVYRWLLRKGPKPECIIE